MYLKQFVSRHVVEGGVGSEVLSVAMEGLNETVYEGLVPRGMTGEDEPEEVAEVLVTERLVADHQLAAQNQLLLQLGGHLPSRHSCHSHVSYSIPTNHFLRTALTV